MNLSIQDIRTVYCVASIVSDLDLDLDLILVLVLV